MGKGKGLKQQCVTMHEGAPLPAALRHSVKSFRRWGPPLLSSAPPLATRTPPTQCGWVFVMRSPARLLPQRLLAQIATMQVCYSLNKNHIKLFFCNDLVPGKGSTR